MTDIYLTVLETLSDPWGLALLSFFAAGTAVVSTALVLDPRPTTIEVFEAESDVAPSNEPLPYEHEDFFDKITRFHNAI